MEVLMETISIKFLENRNDEYLHKICNDFFFETKDEFIPIL